MPYSFKIPRRFALAAAGLAFLMFVGLAFWNAERALRRANHAIEEEDDLHFTAQRLDQILPAGFQPLGTAGAFRDAAFFQDELYISGPTGLWQYSQEGTLLRRYRVGLELPSAPLAGLAPGMAADATEPELYMATAGAGLLAYNHHGFRQVLPEQAPYRKLTAVLPLSTGRLLLGTENSGVLVYDGKHLTPFHPLLANLPVTALAGGDAGFWVGTRNQGVLHWHAGQADHFSEAEGLPDPLVLSIAVDGERALVGTPMGVAEFRAGRFERVLASGFFANALLVRGLNLFVGTLDEGSIEVPLQAQSPRPVRPSVAEVPGRVQRLLAAGHRLFALTDRGFCSLDARGADWRELITGEDSPLADRDIAALEFDAAGRLWVGYFDRGLDILDSDFQRARHVENDHVFCINRILFDPAHNGMAVATANGLVLFDGEGRQREVLGREQGLIANHVSDVALTADGMVLATSAGITTLTASGARSIYAFQGLVNNHVYALAASGSRVLAGTLGGLSILEDGRVLASFTTANSGLRHNWITGVVPVADDWFVGTYGAGMMRLDANGNWQSFPDATGPFTVNNHALVASAARVYAGTLDRGLYVYDRSSGRWTVVKAGLPSLNVTALALRDGYLYVGTDNGLVRIAAQELRAP